MKIKKVLAGGMIFAFTIAMFLANQEGIRAQDIRTIRILGGSSHNFHRIRIEPQTIQVSEETVVVWNNWARTNEVELVVEDTKKCQEVKEVSTGFEFEPEKKCSVTERIPCGETSSLRFTERGTFEYVIKAQGADSAKGLVVVELTR